MNKEISLRKILPVMFGFFIMGFVDIVGVSTSYVKNDFAGMNDTMVNLISLYCFLWFFLLSIPTGMLMNRIGRKKTVLLSFALHVAAMIVPLAAYDFTAVLIAFALIGIGNTLLQVSLNPLVTNVIAGDKLTGTLTLGQFVKAVSSFLGPIIGRRDGQLPRLEDDLSDLRCHLAAGPRLAVADPDCRTKGRQRRHLDRAYLLAAQRQIHRGLLHRHPRPGRR